MPELGFNVNYGILHSLREDRRCRPPIIKGDGENENEVYRDGSLRIELDDQDTKEYQEKLGITAINANNYNNRDPF